MKRTMSIISAAALVIGCGPAAFAEDVKVTDKNSADQGRVEKMRTYASEKLSEANRATHEKMCKGKHGSITDKNANSISIDGKKYAFVIDTPVNKQEEPLLPKTVKVGDRICFTTMKAADGTAQLDKLMAIDRETDTKMRVRDKVDVDVDDKDVEIKSSDDKDVKIKASDDKLKVETDDNKIEVK